MNKKILKILNIFLIFGLFWFSILIHELGHCFFVVLFNGKVILIQLNIISGNLFWKGEMTKLQEFYIHIGGIIFAFIYSVILLLLGFKFKKINKSLKTSGLIIIWTNLITTDLTNLTGLAIFYYCFIFICSFVIFGLISLILTNSIQNKVENNMNG